MREIKLNLKVEVPGDLSDDTIKRVIITALDDSDYFSNVEVDVGEEE